MMILKIAAIVFAFVALAGLFLGLIGLIASKIKLVNWGVGLLFIFGVIASILDSIHFLINHLLKAL